MKEITLDKAGITKILVIKPRAIGDVLLSTAVLPNLRTAFPNSRIDFMVESFAFPVLEGNPYINNIIAYKAKTDPPLSIIAGIRKSRYDLVFDLFANPRTAIITLLSGAQYRVGFPFKWRRIAYNILVPPRSGSVHNVQFNLDALRRVGIDVGSAKPSFFLDRESETFAAGFMSSAGLRPGNFIAFNVGGGWQTKRWPAEKFVRLSRMITSRLRQPVVVFYGPAEKSEAERICLSSDAILAPDTTLRQMGAVLKASRLLVSNDSGPMHIAAALGVPVLAIFGPTSPHLQGPFGNISAIVRNEKLDCLECNLTKCPIGDLCMTELEPETVFQSLLDLISRLDKAEPAVTPIADKGAAKTNESL